jgi:hypothetical protein
MEPFFIQAVYRLIVFGNKKTHPEESFFGPKEKNRVKSGKPKANPSNQSPSQPEELPNSELPCSVKMM